MERLTEKTEIEKKMEKLFQEFQTAEYYIKCSLASSKLIEELENELFSYEIEFISYIREMRTEISNLKIEKRTYIICLIRDLYDDIVSQIAADEVEHIYIEEKKRSQIYIQMADFIGRQINDYIDHSKMMKSYFEENMHFFTPSKSGAEAQELKIETQMEEDKQKDALGKVSSTRNEVEPEKNFNSNSSDTEETAEVNKNQTCEKENEILLSTEDEKLNAYFKKMMAENNTKIEDEIKGLKNEIKGLKNEVKILKADNVLLKADNVLLKKNDFFNSLKIRCLQADLKDIKDSMMIREVVAYYIRLLRKAKGLRKGQMKEKDLVKEISQNSELFQKFKKNKGSKIFCKLIDMKNKCNIDFHKVGEDNSKAINLYNFMSAVESKTTNEEDMEDFIDFTKEVLIPLNNQCPCIYQDGPLQNDINYAKSKIN